MKDSAKVCDRCNAPFDIKLTSWFFKDGDACKKCMGIKDD